MNQHAKRRAASRRQGGHLPAGYVHDVAGLIEDYEFVEIPEKPAPSGPAVVGARSYLVTPEAAGQRLDRFLADAVEAGGEALSRSRLKVLIDEGQVRIADREGLEANAKVRSGETVEINVPAAAAPEPLGEAIPLTVVFEDAHLIVIDKPAGLVVHPAAGHETGTLVNALIAHCGDSLSGIGGVKRPGIVHRIDKDTSGLLAVAKTDAAHAGLAALFADHGRSGSLVREYLAFVWRAPAQSAGRVEAPIGRHPRQRERMAVTRAGKGREAVTHWRLVENFGPAALVACRLETGRTHQIRVHMAHIGHPLLGDPVYATGFKTKIGLLPAQAAAAVTALNRQALHAATLGFEHPVTGAPLLFESALPDDLAALAAALRAPVRAA
jgi:23S rRNA pseudouridine1911/1915/1917 synthase